MKKILYDTTKFEMIGQSFGFDNTSKVESKIQRQLLQLKKDGLQPLNVSTKLLDQPDHNGFGCMGFPKFMKNIYHYD